MLTQSGKTKTILLAEDDLCYQAEVEALLVGGGYTVVRGANSVESAIYLAVRHHPDVMLLDMKLEGGDGIAVLHQLPETQEKVKVLVLSGHQERIWIKHAMNAGAMGYVFKPQVAKQLEDAITTVLRGQVYLPPEVATLYFKETGAHPTFTTQAKIPNLSPRQIEILQLTTYGVSNEKIAKVLNISTPTVKLDFAHIFAELDVPRREVPNNTEGNKLEVPRCNKKNKCTWDWNSRIVAIRKALILGIVSID